MKRVQPIGLAALPALFFLLLCFGLIARADTPEVHECSHIATRYFPPGEMATRCTDTFLHIFPKQQATPITKSSIEIGSFNLLHLGDKLSFYKNYSLVASIVNRWDVVTGLELSPVPGDDDARNAALEKLILKIGSGTVTGPNGAKLGAAELSASYFEPGYIRLLKELRKLDPSWALTLSPNATGENLTHVELAGFFYRSSVVHPEATSYCGGEAGCMLTFPKTVDALVSRVPFLTSFRAGTFSFYLVGTHVRFREPKDVSLFKRILSYFPADQWGFSSPSSVPSGFSKAAEVARFAEVKATIDEMKRIEDSGVEKDLILSGDFNLSYRSGLSTPWRKSWEFALKALTGALVHVTAKTSLSDIGFASEYDHFIFNPDHVKECDGAKAGAFDFTRELAAQLSDLLSHLPDLERKIRSEMSALVVAEGAGGVAPRYQAADIEERVATMKQRLKDEVKAKPFQPFMELVSDHLPISMTCSTTDAGD